MKVIGITGGIGAGKSAVLEYWEQHLGAKLLQTDQIAKKMMLPNTDCMRRIQELFPPNVVTADGELIPEQMAELIFQNECYRKKLNEIVHPEVKKYVRQEVEMEKLRHRYSTVIIESALLIEEHYDEICDEMWYIYTSEENRKKRLQQSRGYSEEKIKDIFASQLTDMEFREKCPKIIDNNGTLDETYRQIEKLRKSKGEYRNGVK
ncbi:MAG: dephospho-CoA kinase [Lachnospiraceae bacterium]